MPRPESLAWMLWQIDDEHKNDPPAANLIRAIQYYTEKYGRVPNRCEVGQDWPEDLGVAEGLQVSRSADVRPFQLRLASDPTLDSNLPLEHQPRLL